MRILEFGREHEKILVMFHASCMTWDFLKNSIDILAREYHLIVPVMPGYDMEDNSDYTSVEDIADKTEEYLLRHGYDEITGLYGISMGGSIAIRILANGRIKIKKAVIDAGITPVQLAPVLAKIIVIRDYSFIMTIKNSMRFFSLFIKEEKYGSRIRDLQKVMAHASRKTIWNNFKSCNTYELPKQIESAKTDIYYWHGSKEKNTRSRDIKFVKQIFPKVKIEEIEGCNHADFVMLWPELFAKKLAQTLKERD